MNTLDLRTTAWLTLAHVALMLTAGLILIIAFDFFVIWALTAHGRDVVAVSGR